MRLQNREKTSIQVQSERKVPIPENQCYERNKKAEVLMEQHVRLRSYTFELCLNDTEQSLMQHNKQLCKFANWRRDVKLGFTHIGKSNFIKLENHSTTFIFENRGLLHRKFRIRQQNLLGVLLSKFDRRKDTLAQTTKR